MTQTTPKFGSGEIYRDEKSYDLLFEDPFNLGVVVYLSASTMEASFFPMADQKRYPQGNWILLSPKVETEEKKIIKRGGYKHLGKR